MRLRYRLLNVFAHDDDPFSGNPLCVFEDGGGLSDEQMLGLARQFNLSETTFLVAPAERSGRRGPDLHHLLRDAVRRTPDPRHRPRRARTARAR